MLDVGMLRTGWNSAWAAATLSYTGPGLCLALRLFPGRLAGRGQCGLLAALASGGKEPQEAKKMNSPPFPPFLPSVSFSFCPGEGNISGVEPTPALPVACLSVHLFPPLPPPVPVSPPLFTTGQPRMVPILSPWLPLSYGSCLGPLLQLHTCVLSSGCSSPIAPSSPELQITELHLPGSPGLPISTIAIGCLGPLALFGFFLSLPKSLSQLCPRLGLTSTPAFVLDNNIPDPLLDFSPVPCHSQISPALFHRCPSPPLTLLVHTAHLEYTGLA